MTSHKKTGPPWKWKYIATTLYPFEKTVRGTILADSFKEAEKILRNKNLLPQSIELVDKKAGPVVQSMQVVRGILEFLRRRELEKSGKILPFKPKRAS